MSAGMRVTSGFVDADAVRFCEFQVRYGRARRERAWSRLNTAIENRRTFNIVLPDFVWAHQDWRLDCLRVLESKIRLAVMRAEFQWVDEDNEWELWVDVMGHGTYISFWASRIEGMWAVFNVLDELYPTPEAAARAAREHLLARIFSSEQWRKLQQRVFKEAIE